MGQNVSPRHNPNIHVTETRERNKIRSIEPTKSYDQVCFIDDINNLELLKPKKKNSVAVY